MIDTMLKSNKKRNKMKELADSFSKNISVKKN